MCRFRAVGVDVENTPSFYQEGAASAEMFWCVNQDPEKRSTGGSTTRSAGGADAVSQVRFRWPGVYSLCCVCSSCPIWTATASSPESIDDDSPSTSAPDPRGVASVGAVTVRSLAADAEHRPICIAQRTPVVVRIVTDILFVCEGNLCRSLLAERLLETALRGEDVSSLTIASAGTRAAPHLEVPHEIDALLRRYGADTRSHTPRPLTDSLVQEASLVVTATREQRTAVVRAHPPAVQYTYTLRQLERRLRLAEQAGRLDIDRSAPASERLSQLVDVVRSQQDPPTGRPASDDVVDPYGWPADVFDETARQTRPGLDLLARHLGGARIEDPAQPAQPDTGADQVPVDQGSTGASRRPGGLAGAFGWSAFSVVGRQASQIVFALYLASLIGPDKFGVVSAATVYATLTTLVLDQGLSAALIQRPRLEPGVAGTVATFNLVMGLTLAVATWGLAPLVSTFFDAPELTQLLRVLGVGLILKAVAINPRAMLMRDVRFQTIGTSDVIGGVLGAVAGVVAATQGAEYWALVWQVLVTDAVVAIILLATNPGGRPNLRFRNVAELLPFSLRVFGARSLAFLSRNTDNILVGRYLGVAQLSAYALAYRALSMPVQLVGQTVSRVTFPALSRMSEEREPLGPTVLRITELLTVASVIPMTFVAVAAPELVHVVLGPEWESAIPVLSILAIAGARETVVQVTHSLMRALGKGRLILWYEVGATSCQLAGIAIGLKWGIVGVATGFLVAGLLLTPVLLVIQYRLTGITLAEQVATVGPFVHAVSWAAGTYLFIRWAGAGELSTLVGGLCAYLSVAIAVLWIAHRPTLRRLVRRDVMKLGGNR